MFRAYYRLTKPGIVYGNLLTTAAGFFMAAQGTIHAGKFFGVLLGVGLIIGASCVFNNYLDRHIDAKMKRTKKRALVTGSIPTRNALIFGSVLGVLGFILLKQSSNHLTVILGAIAAVFYIVIYGYAKRHSVHGTLVGTIPGALPPAAGYTAVTGQLDTGAWLLFAVLVFWQMPHFYAIAIFRLKEYAAAGIPVLPLKRGIYPTKIQIFLYMIGFAGSIIALTAFGYASYAFALIMLLVTARWIRMAIRGFKTDNDVFWARKIFFFSLFVLLSFSALLSIDSVL